MAGTSLYVLRRRPRKSAARRQTREALIDWPMARHSSPSRRASFSWLLAESLVKERQLQQNLSQFQAVFLIFKHLTTFKERFHRPVKAALRPVPSSPGNEPSGNEARTGL